MKVYGGGVGGLNGGDDKFDKARGDPQRIKTEEEKKYGREGIH